MKKQIKLSGLRAIIREQVERIMLNETESRFHDKDYESDYDKAEYLNYDQEDVWHKFDMIDKDDLDSEDEHLEDDLGIDPFELDYRLDAIRNKISDKNSQQKKSDNLNEGKQTTPNPIGVLNGKDLYYKDKNHIIIDGTQMTPNNKKFNVYKIEGSKFKGVAAVDSYEEALEYVAPKKTEWTKEILPKVKKALSQIDAPTEWKNAVIKSEKLKYSGRNVLDRGTPMQSVVEKYGWPWEKLMQYIGNVGPSLADEDNPYKKYWSEYCGLMGTSKNHTFGDALA